MTTVNYDSNAPTYSEGTDAWADSSQFTDASAVDNAYSLGRKERSLKSSMLQAYAGTYDAAGTQTLGTDLAAAAANLTGGANWDGSIGPTAYNATITATTKDGLTPTVAGIYEVYCSLNWITAAAHTLTVAFAVGGTPVTGAQTRSMSVTETASQYQAVTLRCILALAADAEVTINVCAATGTPTLTYRDCIFYIKRMAPSA